MARRFVRLTRESVRALKPGQHITESGITAEAMGDGDIRWLVDIQIRGKSIHRVVGRGSNGTTRTDCEVFIEQHRTAARAGQLALPFGRKLPQLLADVGSLYLEQLQATGGKDFINAEQHWRLHILPYFGAKRANEITPLDVEHFRAALHAKGLSDGMVHLVLASWRRMARKVAVWKITTQPLPTIPMPMPQNARERVLSKTEARALLHAAQNDISPLIYLCLSVSVWEHHCGIAKSCRRGGRTSISSVAG